MIYRTRIGYVDSSLALPSSSSSPRQEHEENLIDLIYEKETLEEKVADLEHTIREWAQKFIDMADKQKSIQVNHESLIISTRRQYKCKSLPRSDKSTIGPLVASILTYCTNQINDAIHRTENAEFIKCKADPAHLLSQLTMAITSTETLRHLCKNQPELTEGTLMNRKNPPAMQCQFQATRPLSSTSASH